MKRSANSSGDIRCFFGKTKKEAETVASDATENLGDSLEGAIEKKSNTSTDSKNTVMLDPTPNPCVNPYDIGLCIGKVMQAPEILIFLRESWKPQLGFIFPSVQEGKQQRKFQIDWLRQYNWLAYTDVKKGGFCKFCVLFAPHGAGIGCQPLKTLVKQPLSKFKKAMEELRYHTTTKYHLFSTEKAAEFVKNFEIGGTKSVSVLVDNKKMATIESNRKRLVPIIKTVIFCARNNLPLRGHRDDGPLTSEDPNENSLSGKEGVFRSLLAFRIDAGDKDLESHLQTASKNCTMISKTIQNEIISSVGQVILSSIVHDVQKSKYFSILCDETTDVSTKEQMTICVRYVNMNTFVVREEFLEFIELKSTTGATIKGTIYEELQKLGLNLNYVRGQGYDGGANMAGKFNGVQALILADNPLAFYTHCFNHALNLCISKSCEISAIKNMMGIIGSVSTFLAASAKRVAALQSIIFESDISCDTKKNKLKSLCATRWIDRHDSVITFQELFPFIVIVLEELEHDGDASTSSKAASYSSAVKRSDFLVGLETIVHCFAYTLKLSKQLQDPEQDLSTASAKVKGVLEIFEEWRSDAENVFSPLFQNACGKAATIGETIKIPRTCARQTHRTNPDTKDPNEWFRRKIFIPLLDHFISELKHRFNENVIKVIAIEGLIPANHDKFDVADILKAALVYEGDLLTNSEVELKAEIILWKKEWAKSQTRTIPQNAVDALSCCDAKFFPNVKILLQIFATLPVSTATAERSFSTLRRLKNYLRSTMLEERLNGLALATIHKERSIDIEETINVFSRMKPRRMETEKWSNL